MKSYTDLTFRGKLRRLGALAQAALAQYELKDPSLDFYVFNTNLLFKVTTASEQFMLRLASPGWRTFENLQAEALWLEALRRDTDIPAPLILPARSGETVLPVSVPGVSKPWNTSLMTWVPGRLLGHSLNPQNLEKMGILFARLHQHGAAWKAPAAFNPQRFEHWLSRDEPNLIVPNNAAAGDAAQPSLQVPVQSLQRLERLHRHVEAAYAAIDREDLRVIHCDLWHDNIKLYRGALYPFDFEDTIWGFRAHDIAMAMLDLLESTGNERYRQLLPAFQRGYTAHLPWPADPIEPFQIGRLLWKVNWMGRFQSQHLAGMLENHLPVFEHYERTGQVICPPPM